MSINQVSISGNLTRDPEMRATQAGAPVMSFCVAVNESRKDPNTNEWIQEPNYIDCTVFGNRAEGLQKWLFKGSKVAVQGRLKWSKWQNNNGENRSKVEVIADRVDFMSPKENTQPKPKTRTVLTPTAVYEEPIQPQYQAQAQYAQPVQQVAQPVAPVQQVASIYDEDIPF